MQKSYLIILGTGMLAGCVATETPESVLSGLKPITYSSPAAAAAAAQTLAANATHSVQTQGYTSAANLPTKGVAAYEGFIGMQVPGDPASNIGGQMALAVDFGGDPGEAVAGRAYNFVDANNIPMTGTMDITNGTLGITNIANPTPVYGLYADIDGTIRDAFAVSTTVNGELTAGFTDGGDTLVGAVSGTQTTFGLTSPIAGGAFATRQ